MSAPTAHRFSPSVRLPRPNSRRGEPRVYAAEQLSPEVAREHRQQRAPASVEALADAGRTGSALRRRLKESGIDPKLARLVLLLYGRRPLRVADIAWALGVSPSTASRWLDRAEREGLVDKLYSFVDRRATAGRLTGRGVDLRTRAERALANIPSNDRPRGVAWGIRATPSWDP